MAVTSAREQSYIKALLVCGAKPRKTGTFRHEMSALEVSINAERYKQSMRYAQIVEVYFIQHVFQGPTSALGNTDKWIEDFYQWQDKEQESINEMA